MAGIQQFVATRQVASHPIAVTRWDDSKIMRITSFSSDSINVSCRLLTTRYLPLRSCDDFLYPDCMSRRMETTLVILPCTYSK
jgi:hypothetical protein